MLIHTTCQTCGNELAMPYTAARDITTTHADCPPQPKKQADKLFGQFTTLVGQLMQPNYTATSHDELNLSALQDRIDTLDNQPPAFGPAALWYATKYGWPVFPLRPRQKVPATPAGFKDASTDPARIKQWWTATPDANIGLPTGHAFDVIDIDLPYGPQSWQTIVNAGVVDAAHGIAQTASGGRHFLVEPTGDGNSAGKLPGIDYRGRGGYVVAPPSWLGDRAHRWTWITKPSPTITGGAA